LNFRIIDAITLIAQLEISHSLSLNPTANSAAVIREAWMLDAVCARRVNSGVGLLRGHATEIVMDDVQQQIQRLGCSLS